MKKMLFAALIATIGFTSSAYAQFTAGTAVVGGSFSYGKNQREYYNYDDVSVKSTTISPRIGAFLADNFEAGVQVSYNKNVVNSDVDWMDDNSSDMFLLAPYGRKYFTLNDWAGFYLQGGIAIGRGRDGGEDLGKSTLRIHSFVAMAAPGVTIRVGEHVGIDFQANLLEYTSTTTGLKGKYEETKSDPYETVKIGPDFSKVSLGISFFL